VLGLAPAALAMTMVLLHRADGGVVAVMPSHVTSLHAGVGTGKKVATPEARCVLWLADGKILSVLEPCDEVRRLLEAAK